MKSSAFITLIVFGSLLSSLSAGSDNEPRSKPAATSQPADDKTLVNVIILEFSPDSQMKPKEVRRRVSEQPHVDGALTALEAEGKVEVLTRPSIMVKWPQAATITVGERLPVKNRENAYEDIGFKLSLEGQWLDQVDPARAYVRLNVDHSYIEGDRVLHQHTKKERVVAQKQTAWFVLPKDGKDDSGRLALIGFTIHRVTNEAGN